MLGTGELYEYNSHGYQHRLRSAYPGLTGRVYYEAEEMDAYGHVTREYRTSGARVLTERSYDPKTGRLKGILTAGGWLQDLSYNYDLAGNMTLRHDKANGRSLYETFDYDGLQRLTGSTVATGLASPPSLTVDYDPAGSGNIHRKYVAGAVAETYS